MRVGETIALDRDDIDWPDRVVVVRASKFNKTREVLLDPTVIEALAAYARIRDRHLPHASSQTFFVSTKGTPVIYGVFGTVFRKLLVGLRGGCRFGGPSRASTTCATLSRCTP